MPRVLSDDELFGAPQSSAVMSDEELGISAPKPVLDDAALGIAPAPVVVDPAVQAQQMRDSVAARNVQNAAQASAGIKTTPKAIVTPTLSLNALPVTPESKAAVNQAVQQLDPQGAAANLDRGNAFEQRPVDSYVNNLGEANADVYRGLGRAVPLAGETFAKIGERVGRVGNDLITGSTPEEKAQGAQQAHEFFAGGREVLDEAIQAPQAEGQFVQGLGKATIEAAPIMAATGGLAVPSLAGNAIAQGATRVAGPLAGRIAGGVGAAAVGASEFGVAAAIPQVVAGDAPISEIPHAAIAPFTGVGTLAQKIATGNVNATTPDEWINLGFLVVGGAKGAKEFAVKQKQVNDFADTLTKSAPGETVGAVRDRLAELAAKGDPTATQGLKAVDDAIAKNFKPLDTKIGEATPPPQKLLPKEPTNAPPQEKVSEANQTPSQQGNPLNPRPAVQAENTTGDGAAKVNPAPGVTPEPDALSTRVNQSVETSGATASRAEPNAGSGVVLSDEQLFGKKPTPHEDLAAAIGKIVQAEVAKATGAVQSSPESARTPLARQAPQTPTATSNAPETTRAVPAGVEPLPAQAANQSSQESSPVARPSVTPQQAEVVQENAAGVTPRIESGDAEVRPTNDPAARVDNAILPTPRESSKHEQTQTIAGKMNLDEFESKGYAPEQVTKQDWVNLQRANRRALGQPEQSGTRYAPFADYEEYHKSAVERAVKAGEEVDPEVLKDYPDLQPKETPHVPEGRTGEAKQPHEMTREEAGDAVRMARPVEAPNALHETLDALSKRANRAGYVPDYLTPERLAAAREQGLVAGGPKNPKLTEAGRSKLYDWNMESRSRENSRASAEDLAVDDALVAHKEAVARAIREGKIQSHPDYPDLKPEARNEAGRVTGEAPSTPRPVESLTGEGQGEAAPTQAANAGRESQEVGKLSGVTSPEGAGRTPPQENKLQATSGNTQTSQLANEVERGNRSRGSVDKEFGKEVGQAVRRELERRRQAAVPTPEQVAKMNAERDARITHISKLDVPDDVRGWLKDAVEAEGSDAPTGQIIRRAEAFRDAEAEQVEADRRTSLTPRQRVEENIGDARDQVSVIEEDLTKLAKENGWTSRTYTSQSSEATYVTFSKGDTEYRVRIAGHEGGGVGSRLGGHESPDDEIRIDNPKWEADARKRVELRLTNPSFDQPTPADSGATVPALGQSTAATPAARISDAPPLAQERTEAPKPGSESTPPAARQEPSSEQIAPKPDAKGRIFTFGDHPTHGPAFSVFENGKRTVLDQIIPRNVLEAVADRSTDTMPNGYTQRENAIVRLMDMTPEQRTAAIRKVDAARRNTSSVALWSDPDGNVVSGANRYSNASTKKYWEPLNEAARVAKQKIDNPGVPGRVNTPREARGKDIYVFARGLNGEMRPLAGPYYTQHEAEQGATEARNRLAKSHDTSRMAGVSYGTAKPGETIKTLYPDLRAPEGTSPFTKTESAAAPSPHADSIKKTLPILDKQVGNEVSHANKLRAAVHVMDGEAPAVQRALADRLRELSPEAAELGETRAPLAMREFFKAPDKSSPTTGRVVESPEKQALLKKALDAPNYESRVAANLEYMGTPASDWDAVPVKGMATTTNDRGDSVKVPEFEFPQGYTPATTAFSHLDNACTLCSHPIKNAFWLQNDTTKQTMLVGSECVTKFGEGKSGERLAKETVWAANRQLLRDAKDAAKQLREAFGVKKEGVTRVAHPEGSKIFAALDKLTSGKAADAGKGYREDATSDGALSAWANKNGPVIRELIDKAAKLSQSPEGLAQLKRNLQFQLSSTEMALKVGYDGRSREYPFHEYKLSPTQVESYKAHAESLKAKIAALSESSPAPSPKPVEGKELQGEKGAGEVEPLSNTAPRVAKSDISRELATRAHSGTSFVPERRAEQRQQEYVDHMNAVWQDVAPLAKTPEQRAILAEQFERYRQGFIAKTNAVLSAASRTMSAMITGPARFPVDSNRKRFDTQMRRYEEMKEWSDRAQRAMRKAIAPEASGIISSDQADAPSLLQKKIDAAKKLQAAMVATNKIVRDKKLTPAEKVEKIKALGISEDTASKALQPDFIGRVGFPDYRLSNNNANIKRMESRVAQIERTRAVPSSETAFEGGKVIDNADANRVQIKYDAKPDRATIEKLKKNGFRWTPSEGVWQRQRNLNGITAAEYVTGVKVSEAKPAAVAAEPETIAVPESITADEDISPSSPTASEIETPTEQRTQTPTAGTVQPSEQSSGRGGEMPSFRDWRYNANFRNGGTIIPNRVGEKFTPEQVEAISEWARGRGLIVRDATPTGIKVNDNSGKALHLADFGAKGVQAEASIARRDEREAADDARRTALDEKANARVSSDWIKSTFSDTNINPYNRDKLSDFLEGKSAKFEGMAAPTWIEGIKKAGALNAAGTDIDWKKLKAAYESSQPTEAPPSGSTAAASERSGEMTKGQRVRYDLDGSEGVVLDTFPGGVRVKYETGRQAEVQGKRGYLDHEARDLETVAASKQNGELERRFVNILKLSADTPAELRAIDLDRVLGAAADQGVQPQFIDWLKKQDISERTRSRIDPILAEMNAPAKEIPRAAAEAPAAETQRPESEPVANVPTETREASGPRAETAHGPEKLVSGDLVTDGKHVGLFDGLIQTKGEDFGKPNVHWVGRGGNTRPTLESLRRATPEQYSQKRAEYDAERRAELIELPSGMDDTRIWADRANAKATAALVAKMRRMVGKGVPQTAPPMQRGYPTIPAEPTPTPKPVKTRQDKVKAMSVAASKESTRYALAGVYVNGGELVATDGRRLYLAKAPVGEWGPDGIHTVDSKGEYGPPPLNDKGEVPNFPAYKDIIPPTVRGTETATVSVADTLRRARAAATMSDESTTAGGRPVLVVLNPDGSLGFAAETPGKGTSEINVHDGYKELGGINADFVVDAMEFHARLGDEKASLFWKAANKPFVFTGERGGTTTVTMPLNLAESVAKSVTRTPEGEAPAGVVAAEAPTTGDEPAPLPEARYKELNAILRDDIAKHTTNLKKIAESLGIDAKYKTGGKLIDAIIAAEANKALPPPPSNGPNTLRGGKRAGEEIFTQAIANELIEMTIRSAKATARAGVGAYKIGQRMLLRSSDFIAKAGPGGQQLSRDIKAIDQAASKRAKNQELDIKAALEGLNKKNRELVAKTINRREGTENVPASIKARADRIRDILDRDMNEAAQLGVMRLVGDMKVTPTGSGKAFPQMPNKKGRDFLETVHEEGLSNPAVYAFAEKMVKEGRAETLSDALSQLQRYRERRIRGVNSYLESTRFELPEDMVEWDPVDVLPGGLQRNAMTIEGIRRWGITESGGDFQSTAPLLAEIEAKTDRGTATVIRKFIAHEFGMGDETIGADNALAGTISNYQTATKLGFSLLSVLRNVGQRFSNTVDYPLSVQLRAAKDFPPFINPWIESARKIKENIQRSGAVKSQTALSSVESVAKGKAVTHAAMRPFGAAEEGNQTYAALVARHGLEHDINRLAALHAKGPVARILDRIVNLQPYGSPEATVLRRMERQGMTGEQVADKLASGRPFTEEEIDTAMHTMVNDSQFAMSLSTKPIWWSTHPWLRLAAKFKPFAIKQTAFIWEHVAKEAAKGNLRPLVAFALTTMLMGELYNIARDTLADKEESALLRVINRPDSRNAKDISIHLLKDIADGGGVGMLADLTFGIGDWVAGPVGGTIENGLKAGYNQIKSKADTLTNLRDFLGKEVAAPKQYQGLLEALDRRFNNRNNRYLDYGKWRGRAFEFKESKENPTLADKAKSNLAQAFGGRETFVGGENTLPYSYAAKQITVGDVDDAKDYLVQVLRDAKTPDEQKTTLEGIHASMRIQSPLGRVADRDRESFLAKFSPEERAKAKKLQADWLADYEKAVEKAKDELNVTVSDGRDRRPSRPSRR